MYAMYAMYATQCTQCTQRSEQVRTRKSRKVLRRRTLKINFFLITLRTLRYLRTRTGVRIYAVLEAPLKFEWQKLKDKNFSVKNYSGVGGWL